MANDNTKLHAPTWVKIISLLILSIAFLIASWVTIEYIDKNKHDWILVSISLAQVALTGIVFLIVYFFSERDHSTKSLRKLSDKFITRDVASSLKKIELYFCNNSPVSLEIEKNWSGIFGKEIKIKCKTDNHETYQASIWVGINVHKVWCIFTFDTIERPLNSSELREKLESSITGAEQTGYEINVTEIKNKGTNNVEALSLWATTIDKEDSHMLSNAHRRLFYANDIAMMTHSILNAAESEGLTHSQIHPPRPR